MASEILIYAISFGFVGLLVYCMLRFGPVEHSWAQFTKEEVDEIKRLNKQAAATQEKAAPSGQPLYKKGMIGHNGIAVYRNGIYAKFCIARKGKYRFVPFSSISGIYPAEMLNPFATTDSALTGLSSWKELQVETKDFMVYMIDSRTHDFQTFIPALKGAMGGYWDSVYRENLPIRGKITEGPFMRHTYLRGEPAPQPAPAPAGASLEFTAPGTQPVQPPAPIEGQGALLAEETPEDMAERCRTLQKGGVIILLIGAVSLVVGLALFIFLESFYGIVPIVLGIMMFLLGGLFMKVKSNPLPIRMHENGIAIPNLMGNEVFIPYGRINRVTETENFIDGALIMLSTSDGMVIGLKKNNRAFMETFANVKHKINDARYDIAVKKDIPKAMGGKAELIAYALALPLGLAFAFFVSIQAFGTMTTVYYLFTFVLVWPPMSIIMLLFIVRLIKKMPKIVGNKPGWKAPMALLAVMLVIFFAGQGFIYNVELPSTSSGGVANMESAPAQSVLNGTFYENQMLNITGHIFVDAGESLEMRNCTIRFGGSVNKASSVYVAGGGALILTNCTLLSANPGIMYSFEAHGSLEMTDCDVTGVWGDAQNVNYDGGLEIYSDNATLTRVTVRNAATNGLFAMNATVTIDNCAFENCGDDGLEIKSATVHIADTTVSDAGWAMVIDDEADVTVTRSVISDCGYGICAEDATVDINNCTFRNNDNYAIEYRTATATSIADNTYVGNEMDVSGSGGNELILMCNMMVVIEAVACAMFIIHAHKTTSN